MDRPSDVLAAALDDSRSRQRQTRCAESQCDNPSNADRPCPFANATICSRQSRNELVWCTNMLVFVVRPARGRHALRRHAQQHMSGQSVLLIGVTMLATLGSRTLTHTCRRSGDVRARLPSTRAARRGRARPFAMQRVSYDG